MRCGRNPLTRHRGARRPPHRANLLGHVDGAPWDRQRRKVLPMVAAVFEVAQLAFVLDEQYGWHGICASVGCEAQAFKRLRSKKRMLAGRSAKRRMK